MGPHTLMEAVGTTSAWRSCPKDCCEGGTGLVTEVIGLYPFPTHLTQTGVVSLVIVLVDTGRCLGTSVVIRTQEG